MGHLMHPSVLLAAFLQGRGNPQQWIHRRLDTEAQEVGGSKSGPGGRDRHRGHSTYQSRSHPTAGFEASIQDSQPRGRASNGRVPSLGCSSGDGGGFGPSEVDWEPDLHLFM